MEISRKDNSCRKALQMTFSSPGGRGE